MSLRHSLKYVLLTLLLLAASLAAPGRLLALPATHFSVVAPASATAGTPINITVTALDATNSTATGYTGTVHFTSTDAQAVLPPDYTFQPGDDGVQTFSVTLKSAGSWTITATDTVTPSITGMSAGTIVNNAPATHLVISVPASTAAGDPFPLIVVAVDPYGNADSNYAGTVHFTSTDGKADLPPNSTLSNGLGTFFPTLKSAGNQTISAADTHGDIIPATSSIRVSPGTATQFVVTGPATTTAGAAFDGAITAEDPYGNTDTNYAGTVQFTSTDESATLPESANFSKGVASFPATLYTAGNQKITVTDTSNASITGTSNNILVIAAPARQFRVSAPPAATAGNLINVTVTALDQFGNRDFNYAGTVHFTSTDGQAGLPANSKLTNGAGTFALELFTAGNQTVSVTNIEDNILGVSGTIVVSPGPAASFSVSAPSPVGAGVSNFVTVTAQDSFGNTATSYTGTVQITSTDGAATLPANSTLTNGVGQFSIILKTLGNQTVTATDTVTPSIAGTSNTIQVIAGAATHFSVSAPGTATAGTAFHVTVTALDQFGNTDTFYPQTVQFTSTDGQALLPANSTLTNGVGTFTVTLDTAGNQTVTATDTVTSSITGTSGTIVVSPSVATRLTIVAPTYPTYVTPGTPFNVTVTAQDNYGNTATGYSGTVGFTSSDPQAVLPANSTLTNGVGTFSATLKTTMYQTITVTDTAIAALTATTATIYLNPLPATHFSVSAPSSTQAGIPLSVTVTALDPYGNIDTNYTGTVNLTSSDPAVPVLLSGISLTQGAGSFSVSLYTVGSRTITATDSATASITGTSAAIVVKPDAGIHFTVSAPTNATAGTALNVTVTAVDAFGNTAPGYAGTIKITSTDGQAILPPNATLTNGVGTFSVTLKSAGTQTVTATDTVTSSLTGSSGTINVSPASSSKFLVTAPATAQAGIPFNVTITAQDPFGNTTTSYAGTIHFISTDALASLPANTALANGVGSFAVTLNTGGNQTLTAADTATPVITGTSGTINVSPFAAPAITRLNPQQATAGDATFTLSITGTGFRPGLSVSFGTTTLASSLVNVISPTQLTVIIGGSDAAPPATNLLAAAGTYNVRVTNPDGRPSNTQPFVVNPQSVTITSLNPPSAQVGSSDQTIIIVGSGFQPNVSVSYTPTAPGPSVPQPTLAPHFASPSEIIVTIPAADLKVIGIYQVQARNPDGSLSPINSASMFMVTKEQNITISNIFPASVEVQGANDGPVQLTINGTGFLQGTDNVQPTLLNPTVTLMPRGGSPFSISDVQYVSQTQLNITVPAPTDTSSNNQAIGPLALAGLIDVVVTNPASVGAQMFTTTTNALKVAPLRPTATTTTFNSGIQLFSVPYDYTHDQLGVFNDLGSVNDSGALVPFGPSKKLAFYDAFAPLTTDGYVLTSQSTGTLTQFNEADDLEVGRGYWINFPGTPTNPLSNGLIRKGATAQSLVQLPSPMVGNTLGGANFFAGGNFQIPLHQGWNMIGDPYISQVLIGNLGVEFRNQAYSYSDAVNLGLISMTLYSYDHANNQYNSLNYTKTLDPFVGYWILALQPSCTLLVPNP